MEEGELEEKEAAEDKKAAEEKEEAEKKKKKWLRSALRARSAIGIPTKWVQLTWKSKWQDPTEEKKKEWDSRLHRHVICYVPVDFYVVSFCCCTFVWFLIFFY